MSEALIPKIEHIWQQALDRYRDEPAIFAALCAASDAAKPVFIEQVRQWSAQTDFEQTLDDFGLLYACLALLDAAIIRRAKPCLEPWD